MKKTMIKSLLAAAAFAAAGAASAQNLAGWSVFGGVSNIGPKVSSGNLGAPSLPNTKIDIEDATQVSGGFSYELSDTLRVTFAVLALPFEHDIVGDGAIAGVGKIGSVKQLPPTVLLQYKLLDANSPLRPYVGAGLSYAYFFGEEGSATLTALTNPGGAPTTLSAKSKLAPSAQLGAQYNINSKWFVDVNVMKTWLKTTATLSTGQKIETKLDPLSVDLWVGYRF
jgi:outer membrane protein